MKRKHQPRMTDEVKHPVITKQVPKAAIEEANRIANQWYYRLKVILRPDGSALVTNKPA